MRRCITAHEAAGFGPVPVGSLWDDDSPFIGAAECFVAVVEAPVEVEAPKPVRKFKAKKAAS